MKKQLLIVAWILFCIVSCTKFDEPTLTPDDTGQEELLTRAGIANPNNPYSLTNVQRALNQYTVAAGIPPIQLTPTHKYVRFHVRDSVQYSILSDSLSLLLFDYPLDKELTKAQMDSYKKNNLHDVMCLYTVLPKNFNYPTEVSYEIIDQLYMQNGDKVAASPNTRSASASVNDENDESNGVQTRVIDGNGNTTTNGQLTASLWEQTIKSSMTNAGIKVISGPSSASPWFPNAQILYVDDGNPGNPTIPLEGLKIVVRDKTNMGYKYTNANGEANEIVPTTGIWFQDQVKYSIRYENDEGPKKWRIKNWVYNVGTTESSSSNRNWYYTITPDDPEASALAAVHRALFFFYNDQDKITNTFPSLDNTVVVACCWDEYSGGPCATFNASRRNKSDKKRYDIICYGKNDQGGYFARNYITQAIFHELGHASHWQTVINTDGLDRNINFHWADLNLKDSYGNAVEYYCASKLFSSDIVKDNIINNAQYTSVGESLLNQGITLTDLQNTVIYVWKLDKWGEKLVEQCGWKVNPEIIKLIFNHHELIWSANFKTDMITGAESVDNDTPANFTLNTAFADNGVTVTNWSVSGNDYEIIADRDNTLRIIFSTPGTKTITLTAKVPYVSTPVTCSKTIQVVDNAPKIVLNSTWGEVPKIGQKLMYELKNYTGDVTWNIRKIDNGAQVGAYNDFVHISSLYVSKYNCFIIPRYSGNYKLSAEITNQAGFREDITKDIRVPAEGSTNSTITGIYAYQSVANGTRSIYYRDIPLLSTDQRLGGKYDFCAFTALPLSSNPITSSLRPLLKEKPISVYGNQRTYHYVGVLDPMRNTLVCYIANKANPGMVALYSVREYHAKGDIMVYDMTYVTRENKQNKRTQAIDPATRDMVVIETKNNGIIGYAYPSEGEFAPNN